MLYSYYNKLKISSGLIQGILSVRGELEARGGKWHRAGVNLKMWGSIVSVIGNILELRSLITCFSILANHFACWDRQCDLPIIKLDGLGLVLKTAYVASFWKSLSLSYWHCFAVLFFKYCENLMALPRHVQGWSFSNCFCPIKCHNTCHVVHIDSKKWSVFRKLHWANVIDFQMNNIVGKLRKDDWLAFPKILCTCNNVVWMM